MIIIKRNCNIARCLWDRSVYFVFFFCYYIGFTFSANLSSLSKPLPTKELLNGLDSFIICPYNKSNLDLQLCSSVCLTCKTCISKFKLRADGGQIQVYILFSAYYYFSVIAELMTDFQNLSLSFQTELGHSNGKRT